MTGPRSPAGGETSLTVVHAGVTDLDILSHLIADAFFDLAPSQWLINDPDARREIFPGYFKLYVEHAMGSGLVYTTADRAGTALWMPVGANPACSLDGYDARLAEVTGRWARRFVAFDAALDRHHRIGVPHHHLAILAVRPDRQGQGIGGALLRGYHAILDEAPGAPAYLEAAGARSRDLYLKHGYTLWMDAPFYLPYGGPPMWPMWRASASART